MTPEESVKQKLGWWIEGYSPFVIAKPNGATTRASYREYNAYHLCLSQEAEIQKLREALEATNKALEFAIEHLWSGVNRLMQMRDSSSLTPTQEAWCRSAKGALLSRAALTPSPSKNWMVCPKCGFYLDTPNHELGCAAGEQK